MACLHLNLSVFISRQHYVYFKEESLLVQGGTDVTFPAHQSTTRKLRLVQTRDDFKRKRRLGNCIYPICTTVKANVLLTKLVIINFISNGNAEEAFFTVVSLLSSYGNK